MNQPPLKIWLMSDLHVDTSDFLIPAEPPDFDVIVIVGDIADGMEKSFDWLKTRFAPLGRPIVYVPGNHDHYGGDLHAEAEALRLGAEHGINVLYSGQWLVLGGVRLVGAVLWTDYAIAGDGLAAHSWARTSMPDMRAIDVGRRRVYSKDLAAEHERHLQGILDVLRVPHDGPTVVLTHHAPHARSLRDHYANDPSDASFASDLGWVMRDHRPEFWFHGHTHSWRYYEVDETQVICNPRGYVQKHESGDHTENDQFDPHLIVEV